MKRALLLTKLEPATPLLCFLACLACPGTGPTGVVIRTVEIVDGDVTTPRFDLKIQGRGFGLSNVQYDVKSGAGTSSAALSLLLWQGTDDNRSLQIPVPRNALTVQSPQSMIARIRLASPLRAGNYGVALRNGKEELHSIADAFLVPSNQPQDGGFADASPDDAQADLGVDDVGFADGGVGDADPVDRGFPDTGPPDSGLEPFRGNFGFRQQVRAVSPSASVVGTTISVPIQHQERVALGQAQVSGRDFALFQGNNALPYQWEDTSKLGTNELVMIARLAEPIPANGGAPLLLYFGDPAAQIDPSDTVFEFVQRFGAPVAPEQRDEPTAWYRAEPVWIHCNVDYPAQTIQPQGTNGAYCGIDAANSNPSRATFSTPRITTIRNTISPQTQRYEMSFVSAGRMIDGNADLVYLSHFTNNSPFDQTLLFPTADYSGFVPNGNLTFRETNNQNRSVEGWRMPQANIQWWQRTKLRFVPSFDQPSFHFRHLSLDGDTSNNSFFAVDEWTVRLAVEPEFTVTLGPVETR